MCGRDVSSRRCHYQEGLLVLQEHPDPQSEAIMALSNYHSESGTDTPEGLSQAAADLRNKLSPVQEHPNELGADSTPRAGAGFELNTRSPAEEQRRISVSPSVSDSDANAADGRAPAGSERPASGSSQAGQETPFPELKDAEQAKYGPAESESGQVTPTTKKDGLSQGKDADNKARPQAERQVRDSSYGEDGLKGAAHSFKQSFRDMGRAVSGKSKVWPSFRTCGHGTSPLRACH